MSTGAECEVIEVEPGEWYYVLEESDAPKNAFDWREYATAYGPFPTEDAAQDHLVDHHPNPGGWSISRHVEGFEPDEVLTRLLAACDAGDLPGSCQSKSPALACRAHPDAAGAEHTP
jgi:hypothetical protein